MFKKLVPQEGVVGCPNPESTKKFSRKPRSNEGEKGVRGARSQAICGVEVRIFFRL